MKRLFAIVLVLTLMLPAYSCAANGDANISKSLKPILVTAYRQVGWGDSVQIGYVDENGGLWFLEGYDHDLMWPYNQAEQLSWIASAKGFTSLGTLSFDDLFVLNSLIQCVEDQGADWTPAANDAGTETSYAVLYTEDAVETIMLGISGDDRFENTDATAQALYLFLRKTFPDVTSYYGEPLMAPVGFQTLSLLDFCGYSELELKGLRVMRTDIDCEAGTEPVLLSDDEAAEIYEQILRSRITGKHSCMITTGGSTVYSFLDETGETVATFEYYHDLLVRRDGMYIVEQVR